MKDNIKVAYLTLTRFEHSGGGQGILRYVNELYKNMTALQPKYGISIEKRITKPVKVFGEGLSLEFNSVFTSFERYDILHNPIGTFPLHGLNKTKYIVTLHDLNTRMKGIKGWLWNSLVYRRGLAYSINNADAIIVNSSQTMKEVLGKGGKKNKIFIINLGLDGRFTKRKQKKQQENKFTVGYIGSFAQNKNVKFLLNAANEYHNTHHGYDPIFSIWGNKSFEYNNLLKIARGNKNIVFNGFAPESRLVQIYDSFDVFVFPSYYEGFGLPILEAQARDLPVIIYKKAKIPVEVRKYCFEAESQEHMAQIIEDLKENGYNEKLQMKATKYARSFTWEKTAKETLEVYKKLI